MTDEAEFRRSIERLALRLGQDEAMAALGTTAHLAEIAAVFQFQAAAALRAVDQNSRHGGSSIRAKTQKSGMPVDEKILSSMVGNAPAKCHAWIFQAPVK